MFSLSSWLESKNRVLHLRTMLDWQRIQKKVEQTETGCTLYPELRDKEKTYSSCSTWQDRRTKRVPYGLECVEEILQENRLSTWTFYKYSRSISQGSSSSWITTRNRMEWTKVQRDGWTCQRRPYISSHSRGKEKIPRTMVSYLEQVRQKWDCLDEKSSTQRTKRTSWRAYPSMINTVYTTSQAKKLKSLVLQINTDDCIPLQAHRGGTSLNGIGNELIFFHWSEFLLLQLVSFVVDAHGIGHRTKTKTSPGPNFHESRAADIHSNQPRSCRCSTWSIRQYRFERKNFVPPNLRGGKHLGRRSEQNTARTEIWTKWQLLTLAPQSFMQI